MESSRQPDTRKKLRSAAVKAAGAVTAAGMLFNAAVDQEDLLTSPEAAAANDTKAPHVQAGARPLYTVTGKASAPIQAPTKAELLRERVIALPAPVKGLVLLPLWTIGAIGNYALSLLLGLFAKVFGGSVLTFLFQFALLLGLFALALKLLFPSKKLKDLFTKRNLIWMAVSALVLTAADMLLKTWYEPYAKVRTLILLALVFVLLSLLAWRILRKRHEKKQPTPEATYEII